MAYSWMTASPDPGVSLRQYFERLLDDHAKSHVEHQQAHDREHQGAQKAIEKAEALVAQNKADSNEWRAAMDDRESSFSKVEMVQAASKRLDVLERTSVSPVLVETMQHRLDTLEDANLSRSVREEQSRAQLTRTMAVIGLAAAVGGFLLNLLAERF